MVYSHTHCPHPKGAKKRNCGRSNIGVGKLKDSKKSTNENTVLVTQFQLPTANVLTFYEISNCFRQTFVKKNAEQ